VIQKKPIIIVDYHASAHERWTMPFSHDPLHRFKTFITNNIHKYSTKEVSDCVEWLQKKNEVPLDVEAGKWMEQFLNQRLVEIWCE
jgi:hypothetical protein